MKYKIIDNFLNEKYFDYLHSLTLKKVGPSEISVQHNKINNNGKIETSCISKDILEELQKSCHEKAIKILNELAPHKTELYEYTDFNIIETGKNYTFPIHRDHINKLLSGVIYIKPDINTGTIIYEKDGKIKYTRMKKISFLFSRTEEESGTIIKVMVSITE